MGDERFRFKPSVQLSEEFTSNVFYTETDPEADYVTHVRPGMEARYDSDLDRAHLRVAASSNSYLRNSGLNGISIVADGSLERKLTKRVTLFGDGAYSFYPHLDAITEDAELIQSSRPDLQVWNAGGGFGYAHSESSASNLRLDYYSREYSDSEAALFSSQRDHETISGVLSHAVLLSARDRFEFALQASQTRYSDVGAGTQEDRLATFSGSWYRSLDPVWSAYASIGGRVLYSDPEDVASETTVGFIGGASLERKTPTTHARLTLSRVTQPGSGVGASQDINSINGNLRVDLAARLAFFVDGRWQAYDSAANGAIFVGFAPCAPGDTLVGVSCFRDSDNEVAYELTSASARLDWRAWEHWVTFLQYRYLHQTSSGEIAVSEFYNHRVMLGVRYALPIDVF